MTFDYFELRPVVTSRQWVLDVPIDADGNEVDPWQFTRGERLGRLGGLVIPIEEEGPRFDFSFAHFDIPVVTPDLGMLIEAAAKDDVQLVSAPLKTGEAMCILVATRRLDCIDKSASEIDYFSEAHARAIGRPEKAGKPNMVLKLMIDRSRTEDRSVLRIKDWEGPLIVREDVAEMMRRRGVSGITLVPVT